MTTPAILKVQAALSQMGISVDTQTVAGVVYDTSAPKTVMLSDSMLIALNEYKLSTEQVLDHELYIYQSDSSTDLTNYENLLSYELFVEGFTQTEPVALNLETNSLRFIADSTELNTLVCFRVLDTQRAVNSILYSQTVQNPVREVKKGEITIKADTPLDVALKYQKLQAISGDNVLEINATRYSTGKIKGRR